MSERSITVAAVQSEPAWFDLAATTEKTVTLIAEAARRGARIVAFPEVWLPGYPVFLWLGDEQWQADYRRTYVDNSAEYGGPEHKRIAAAAAENNILVVLGLSERDADGRIFMAQWIIDETGKTVLARRKLKPSSAEGSFYSPGDPNTNLIVVDTNVGTLGALNCSEHKRPMLRHIMFGLREEIHIAAWPAFGLVPEVVTMGAKVNMNATSAYAAEGGMFVLAPTRARRLRRGFCSGSSYGLPCRSHGPFEDQNPVGGLVIDVVGDADWLLLVVAAFVVITPADKPNAALFSFAIAQMRFRIEATPMHAKLEPGARFSRRDLSLGE